MESIIDYLVRNLKAAGPRRWAAMLPVLNDGVPERDHFTEHSLRKIAYGDRKNPGLQDAQRLMDYFLSIERGERQLPEPAEKAEA